MWVAIFTKLYDFSNGVWNSSRSLPSRLFWSPPSRLPQTSGEPQALLQSNAAVTDDESPLIAEHPRKPIYFVTVLIQKPAKIYGCNQTVPFPMIKGLNRNLTTDNLCTSYPLAVSLLRDKITIIRTLRKTKRENTTRTFAPRSILKSHFLDSREMQFWSFLFQRRIRPYYFCQQCSDNIDEEAQKPHIFFANKDNPKLRWHVFLKNFSMRLME